jgi:hypothetical protein
MNTRIRTSINAVKNMIRAPYAWPGGYNKVLVMTDGESMCAQCVTENYRLILRSTRAGDDSWNGWVALYEAVHWEGAPVQCANCNKELPSEYGDPDAADAS